MQVVNFEERHRPYSPPTIHKPRQRAPVSTGPAAECVEGMAVGDTSVGHGSAGSQIGFDDAWGVLHLAWGALRDLGSIGQNGGGVRGDHYGVDLVLREEDRNSQLVAPPPD